MRRPASKPRRRFHCPSLFISPPTRLHFPTCIRQDTNPIPPNIFTLPPSIGAHRVKRVTPHGRPDAAQGVQPGLRGLDGETPSCTGLCGGRTRSKSNGCPGDAATGPPPYLPRLRYLKQPST